MFSIMAYIVFGMLAGWLASLLVRRDMHPSDWGLLFIVGVAGSLVGGIVVNLLLGQGFKLHPGGLISSIVFACLILWIVTRVQNRGQGKHGRPPTARTASPRAAPGTTSAEDREPAGPPRKGWHVDFTEIMSVVSRGFEGVAPWRRWRLAPSTAPADHDNDPG